MRNSEFIYREDDGISEELREKYSEMSNRRTWQADRKIWEYVGRRIR